jgi:hypothetical protein
VSSIHDQPTQPVPNVGPSRRGQPPRESGRWWLFAAGGVLVAVLVVIGVVCMRPAATPNDFPPRPTDAPVSVSVVPSPSPTATYTVAAGDTMKGIAQKMYGDPDAWMVIYQANQAAIGPNPDALKVGTQLVIPAR